MLSGYQNPQLGSGLLGEPVAHVRPQGWPLRPAIISLDSRGLGLRLLPGPSLPLTTLPGPAAAEAERLQRIGPREGPAHPTG